MEPNLTSQGGAQTLMNQAYNQGQALQNQYNSQSQQLQGQYQGDVSQANQYGANEEQFAQQAPQLYQQYLGQMNQASGYNPQVTSGLENSLGQATQGAVTAQNIMGALPQDVNQMGNYSGATSGQVANNYANMSGTVNQQMTNATNQLQAIQGDIGAQSGFFGQSVAGAGQILGAQGQSYQGAYQSAVGQMQTAGQTMAAIENLQQQQGSLTSQQVTAYQNSYNDYVKAQAAAQSASAQMIQAQALAAQTTLQNQQTQAIMNSPYYQEFLKYGNNTPPNNTGVQPTTPMIGQGNMTGIFSPSNIASTFQNGGFNNILNYLSPASNFL